MTESLRIIHKFAREHLELSSQAMKRNYDHKSNFKPFVEGDCVWLFNLVRKKGRSSKLQCPWKGPDIITKCLSDVVFRIQERPNTKPNVVHYNRLKQYTGENKPTWFTSSLDSFTEQNDTEIYNATEESENSTNSSDDNDESASVQSVSDYNDLVKNQPDVVEHTEDTELFRKDRRGRMINRPKRCDDFV